MNADCSRLTSNNIDPLTLVSSDEGLHAQLERLGIARESGNVLKHDPLFREAWYNSNGIRHILKVVAECLGLEDHGSDGQRR